MSTTIKKTLILFILIIFLINLVNIAFATEDDEYDDENNYSASSSESSSENNAEKSSTNVKAIKVLSNIPEANLGLNNILNIILITIGFLLILLAIAILIRLKR